MNDRSRRAAALIALAVTLVAGRAQGQLVVAAKLGESRAAMLMSSASLGYRDWTEDVPGWTAGLSGRLRIAGPVALQVEALFTQKGAPRLRIGYIEAPLLLHLGLPSPSPVLRGALLGGVAPSWLVRCRHFETASAGGIAGVSLSRQGAGTVLEPCSNRITEVFDFGVVYGAELRLAFGLGDITGEIRRTRGVTNVSSAYRCCETRNAATTWLLGYAIRFR